MKSIKTNVVQVSLVMYLCIAFILMKLVIVFCTLRDICDSKLRALSRMPHRYLTLLLNSMRSGSALIGPCAALLSCCMNPNNMYSILSKFIFSCILSIWSFMLLNMSSINSLVVLSCNMFPALGVFVENGHLQSHWYLLNVVSPY